MFNQDLKWSGFFGDFAREKKKRSKKVRKKEKKKVRKKERKKKRMKD